MLKSRATGPAICSESSISKRGRISSGPHDLLTFRFMSCFSTIKFVTRRSNMVEFVVFSILGILPFDSLMNTLENCCRRMFAFSASSNFIESLSLGLESKGATTLIDCNDFCYRYMYNNNKLLMKYIDFRWSISTFSEVYRLLAKYIDF